MTVASAHAIRFNRAMVGLTSSLDRSQDLPCFTADPAALLRAPRATYRLQLGPDLTFDDAARLVPYLAALGISDCYISPFFEAASNRSHGYDVSDHGRLRAELGGETAFDRFAQALRHHGLGLLVDVVPNHMGIAGSRNAWWFDVLMHGASSPYASFFDIDWMPVKGELANKVLLPLLGDQYGVVLDRGELRLQLSDGRFTIHYYDTVLPVAPRTYVQILGHRLEQLESALGSEHAALLELKAVFQLLLTIPHRTETDPERLAARHRETEIAHQKFAKLLETSGDVRDFITENVRLFNGTSGNSRSFDLLDGLLHDQVYRLASWRVAGEEVNYRRFFDINELAAIRTEDPRVFAETHRLILRLVREGIVTGLRIDHPDGLYAPGEYFRRLQRACYLETERGRVAAEAAADSAAWRDGAVLERYDAIQQGRGAPLRPFYIVAEKILALGERLPDHWAVLGTTGYEFLSLLNGLFIDRQQADAVERIYVRLLRHRPSFPEIVYQSKRLIMETAMAAELSMLGHRLDRISEKHRSSRDFTLASLTRALREIIASFPVYRTYVGDSGNTPSAHDHEYIERAVVAAKRRTPTMDVSIYDWIRDLLLLRFPAWADEADRAERLDLVLRFQQTTGPVTAKGYEDTAFYRYYRLVSLNEVGGDPSRFGTRVAEFHAANVTRQASSPHALSATSTHDTKRSEDVRARINVLSEIPGEWREKVGAWQKVNRKYRVVVDGQPAPGPNEEYLLYQTLVGAWPISVERLQGYLLKAIHEAKVETSWINPAARYDEAILSFAAAVLDPARSAQFLVDFTRFQTRVAAFGALNSLAQLLIKVTAPGVPDFYQGTELWDLSLVDPDNRRPVDWALRRRLLEDLAKEIEGTQDLAGLARNLLETRENGRVKLYLTRQTLAFRRARTALFERGEYRPLEAQGSLAEHVCAFARVADGEVALTVVPLHLAKRRIDDPPLGSAYWQNTWLPIPDDLGARFDNVLTGETVEVAAATEGRGIALGRVLASFPVALMVRTA
jgi:(1->4)-alpha-D-glucan 1-alpha-D-glucosylmutase